MATGLFRRQIPAVTHPAMHPPYGLASVSFRHRALASLAARAPIGPARDVALAWFVCARLIDGAAGPEPLSDAARTARAAAARTWLAGAGLSASVRLVFAKLIDACGTATPPDRARIAKGVSDALKVTGDQLDAPSRAELEPFAKA